MKLFLFLACTASALAQCVCPIKLPIEVVGVDGTTVAVPFDIPSRTDVTQPATIHLQIHNLKYETQASIKINASAWYPINSTTATLLGNAKVYGGIGGGFHTIALTLPLPGGILTPGSGNIATFRFNATDGLSSGFRVLGFNIRLHGVNLINAARFQWDDVAAWRPPSSAPADIAAGQVLWSSASLDASNQIPTPISAHCGDCHAIDGSDLKYFNYSNASIVARSIFHSLTPQQGMQIASYIRSLPGPNPGRPWNPPYQPGPRLDQRPVADWSAGAGLGAVLETDAQMIAAMFPGGFPSDATFAATSRLSQRNTPEPFQFPDWNDWLPRVHPADAFGAAFSTSPYATTYATLRANLKVANAAVYAAQKYYFDQWNLGYYNLYVLEGTPIWANPAQWTPASVAAMQSLPRWGLVKMWELMHAFQLEGLNRSIAGAQADARGWYSPMAFSSAPHMLKLPNTGVAGAGNGGAAYYVYFSNAWYTMQLLLNGGAGTNHQPIDWGYEAGFIQNIGSLSSPQAGLQTLWLIKGLQISQANALNPAGGTNNGWQPLGVNQISLLVTPEWMTAVWTGVPPATRTAIAQGYLKAWLAQVTQFTAAQWYQGWGGSASSVPVAGGNPYSASLPDAIWYTIPRLKFLGVDPALIAQFAAWAQTVWPLANWQADAAAACSWQGTNIVCSE